MSNQYIYHEPQESALCGQHCLNNLLQSPLFTASDLSDIALELDEQERKYMLEGDINADTLRYLSEASGNVDESGNFSIQVLRTALQRFDVELLAMRISDGCELDSSAFIVNRSSHWFTIRRIHGKWWDLNSLHKSPQLISDFYVSAFLTQLVADGYSVFKVAGNYDENRYIAVPSGYDEFSSNGGRYLPIEALLGLTNTAVSTATAFLGKGNRLGGSTAPPDTFDGLDDEDMQLATAISLSLAETSQPTMTDKEKMREKRLKALGMK